MPVEKAERSVCEQSSEPSRSSRVKELQKRVQAFCERFEADDDQMESEFESLIARYRSRYRFSNLVY